VSYYFHVPAALPPAEDSAVPIEQKTGGGLKRPSARNTLTIAGNGAPVLLFILPGLSSSKNYKWLFGCI